MAQVVPLQPPTYDFSQAHLRIQAMAYILFQKQEAISSLKTGSVQFHFDEGKVKAKVEGVLDIQST